MTRLTIVGRRFRVLALVLVGMQALATPGATAWDEPRAASPSPLALVAGEPVTEAEVEALIAPQLAELRQRGYQLRSQALDELIARRVVEREAVRRGVSVEALVKSEVDEKAVPTDADRRALTKRTSPASPGRAKPRPCVRSSPRQGSKNAANGRAPSWPTCGRRRRF